MKDTSRRAGGGQLKESMLDEFAELWAAYILGMRREFKIDIPAISIQNEPDLEYYYPTCRFEPGHCARAMAAVERRLRQEKLSVQVLGPDTCRIYNLPDYLDAMDKAKASPGTPALTHLYDLSIPFERVDRDPARWREAKALALRYRRGLWMVETANYLSWGTEAGSYDEALIWAQKIHHALVEGDCAVVCYWSLFFDKRGEALIYSPRSEAEEVEITPKFYTSMHYYRFVRPGMIRCTATPSVPGLLLSAFRKEKGGEGDRVIVMVHPGDEARSLRFEPGCTGRWDRYVTAATKSCVREAPVESGEMLELPARSVLTLVRSGPP
jgi:O-glycosyl hydrolase